MTNIPTVSQYPRNIRYSWNDTLQRAEQWKRHPLGDREWYMHHADPADERVESFMGAPQFVPALLGVMTDLSWATNGDPAPVAANFVALNARGGGMIVRCLGAGVDDWVAMHSGGNYPHVLSECLIHNHMHMRMPVNTSIHALVGIVGASGLETGNNAAWTTPDDGVYMEYDTDVDNIARFVTRGNGVSTSTELGAQATTEFTFDLQVNAAGTEVKLVLNGTVVATHTINLPTEQLKWIWMIQSRAAAQRDGYVEHYRSICVESS